MTSSTNLGQAMGEYAVYAAVCFLFPILVGYLIGLGKFHNRAFQITSFICLFVFIISLYGLSKFPNSIPNFNDIIWSSVLLLIFVLTVLRVLSVSPQMNEKNVDELFTEIEKKVKEYEKLRSKDSKELSIMEKARLYDDIESRK